MVSKLHLIFHIQFPKKCKIKEFKILNISNTNWHLKNDNTFLYLLRQKSLTILSLLSYDITHTLSVLFYVITQLCPTAFWRTEGCLPFTKFSKPLHLLCCLKKKCPVSSFEFRLSADIFCWWTYLYQADFYSIPLLALPHHHKHQTLLISLISQSPYPKEQLYFSTFWRWIETVTLSRASW